jgi:hypothetical protein
MLLILTSKMLMRIVKKGKHGINMCIMTVFLYHANKLFVPANSVRVLFLQEAHGGDLMGHFEAKKTEDVLTAHFFWPKMRHDMECYMSRCTTCNKAKS